MANIGYLIKIIRFLTAAVFLFYNLPYKIKEKSNKQSFFPRTNSVSRLLLGFSCEGCKSHKPCECVSHFFSPLLQEFCLTTSAFLALTKIRAVSQSTKEEEGVTVKECCLGIPIPSRTKRTHKYATPFQA